jgi:hypothetical protein
MICKEINVVNCVPEENQKRKMDAEKSGISNDSYNTFGCGKGQNDFGS